MQTSPLADQVFVITSLSTFLAGAEPDMDLLLQHSHTTHQSVSTARFFPVKFMNIFSFLLFFSQTFICFNKLTIIDQKMILSLKEIQF